MSGSWAVPIQEPWRENIVAFALPFAAAQRPTNFASIHSDDAVIWLSLICLFSIPSGIGFKQREGMTNNSKFST